jgi:hypothetical protein
MTEAMGGDQSDPVPGRRGLQTVLRLIGAVAAVEGARGVLQGTGQVIGGRSAPANVDSEFRFYASWYCVLGVLLLQAARRPEAATVTVRATGTGFLVAACGRVLSMRSRGRPHPSQRLLMAAEFTIPVVIVPWQTSVARRVGKGVRGPSLRAGPS